MTIGAIDPFGQTLLGGRETQPGPPEAEPDPLLVDSVTIGRYTEENRLYEAQQLA